MDSFSLPVCLTLCSGACFTLVISETRLNYVNEWPHNTTAPHMHLEMILSPLFHLGFSIYTKGMGKGCERWPSSHKLSFQTTVWTKQKRKADTEATEVIADWQRKVRKWGRCVGAAGWRRLTPFWHAEMCKVSSKTELPACNIYYQENLTVDSWTNVHTILRQTPSPQDQHCPWLTSGLMQTEFAFKH